MINSFPIPVECKLSTAEQSRQMDSKTINEFGVDGFTLMELAASLAASHIKNLEGEKKSGLFICGKGNNAGDALAVARYLINDSGHKAAFCFVLGDDDLSTDAEKNLTLLKRLKEQGAEIASIDNLESIDERNFDYIVDGIFGTGLNSDLRGDLSQTVKKINSFSLPVYSMDVPSGLHADSGQILNACVKADYTFTFGSNKIGLHWKEARKYTGEVIFCNLPFPTAYRNYDAVLINQALMDSLPEIKRNANHKYDGGVVHIMAGSAGLTGAAIMSAQSAWKQGAGAVFLYAPKALLSIYEIVLPNIIKVGVGKKTDSHFKKDHAGPIMQSIKNRKGVLLAGPGMGTASETGECLIRILEQHNGFTVLDADALSFWNLLSKAKISVQQKQQWLLTPHIGEASNYLGGDFSNDYERFEWTKEFVTRSQSSILMKGDPTILSFIKGNKYITGYDASMFSRAGFGDVLSGALASNIAITKNPELATVSALYNGYMKFHNHQDTEPFGPEHLL